MPIPEPPIEIPPEVIENLGNTGKAQITFEN